MGSTNNTDRLIAITAYERPDIFRLMLDSLQKNNLSGSHILVQIEPSDHVRSFLDICEDKLHSNSYTVVVNEQRLGIRRNPFEMLGRVVSEGSSQIIYLEEDLLLSPDTVGLADWYFKQDLTNVVAMNLLSGGCSSSGFLSRSEFPTTCFKTKSINSLGLFFTATQWHEHLQPNWMRNPEGALNHKGKNVIGWDLSISDYILQSDKLRVLQPILARATHIPSDISTHATATFQKLAFENLELARTGKTSSDFEICEDLMELPHSIRSHINLREELNQALLSLKRENQRVMELSHIVEIERKIVSEKQSIILEYELTLCNRFKDLIKKLLPPSSSSTS